MDYEELIEYSGLDQLSCIRVTKEIIRNYVTVEIIDCIL